MFWKKRKARKLLDKVLEIKEDEDPDSAIVLYHEIIRLDSKWSTPYYNLGLIYKYKCDWLNAFDCNLKATDLDNEAEAAWWNLGIAATALGNWRIAREAWNKFELNYEVNDEITDFNLGNIPIRINPDGNSEVVWCKRIDPARAIIKNIPLPDSKHRFNDLVLIDGTPVGYRTSEGIEYPVFNELQILTKSAYKIYSITVETEKQSDIDKLENMCKEAGLEMEDWSTIKYLCKQCSEGTVHDHHDHDIKEHNIQRYIGFAALNAQLVKETLANWRVVTLCDLSEIKLELE